MFAIAFDMVVAQLEDNYGEPYNNAYYEIKHVLADYDFVNLQGSVYLTTNPSLANLYNAIQALRVLSGSGIPCATSVLLR